MPENTTSLSEFPFFDLSHELPPQPNLSLLYNWKQIINELSALHEFLKLPNPLSGPFFHQNAG
jgi:hypothetical protein